jgi:hypothetical protein
MADEPSFVSVGREPGLRFQFGSLERGRPALSESTPTTRGQARIAFEMPCWQIYEEANLLKCQIGISSSGHGGRRRSLRYAFTEEGVAMLSSVLRSPRAIANRSWKDGLRSATQPSTFNPQLPGGSDWAQLEAGTFRFRDPLNKEGRFIPLRLDDALGKTNWTISE